MMQIAGFYERQHVSGCIRKNRSCHHYPRGEYAPPYEWEKKMSVRLALGNMPNSRKITRRFFFLSSYLFNHVYTVSWLCAVYVMRSAECVVDFLATTTKAKEYADTITVDIGNGFFCDSF